MTSAARVVAGRLDVAAGDKRAMDDAAARAPADVRNWRRFMMLCDWSGADGDHQERKCRSKALIASVPDARAACSTRARIVASLRYIANASMIASADFCFGSER